MPAMSFAKEWGLHLVELREVWGKNLQVISDAQIEEAQKILAKYNLQVTDISSPLYKVDWPGAPPSQYGSKADLHGADEVGFRQQDEEPLSDSLPDRLADGPEPGRSDL